MKNRLMISMDRNLLDPNSSVSERFKKYSRLFENLDIIVFSKKFHSLPPAGARLNNLLIDISSNCAVYPTSSFNKLFYIFDAIKIANKLKPDVVYGQDPWFETGITAFIISKIHKAKLFLQVHTDIFSKEFSKHSIQNKIRVLFSKWLLPKADKIRVVSEKIKKSLEEMGIKSEKIVVLPIIVKKLPLSRAEGRDEFSSEQKRISLPFQKNILMVGRLEKEKNNSLAIKAFSKIAVKYSDDVGLVIVGEGRLKKNLENLVKNLGIEKQVIFIGKVNNIFDYYKSADIYLHTSKYEGYGMSLIEAALSELPIVTTNVGVVGDVLIDKESCLVTKWEETNIADKLEEILENDDLANNLGNMAKNKAESHVLNEENYLKKYRETFKI
jgi:glycosyltransferase involved in cell wall biosynthesis